MSGSKKKGRAERQEAKAFSIANASDFEVFGNLPTSSGAIVNPTTALQVPAVLQAVRLIAETVGSLPCKVYSSGSSKEAADSLSPFRLVHDRANPWTSAGQLRIDLTADALLHGAGYAQVIRSADGRPLELQRLSPTTVERRTESDGEPFYMVADAAGRRLRLSYLDVLYVPAFNGLSPIHAGKKAIGLAMVLEKHGEQFFGSGARPSGVITNEKSQGGEAGTAVVANVLKSHRRWRETANGDPLILDAGWGYNQPAMTSTDAQFLENRKEQVREIARIFGVPPSMIYELTDGTYSNTEQQATGFLQLCLRPWLDRWQDAYATVLLTEAEQRTHYFEFVIDDLQRADAAGRAAIFGKLVAMRAMTPNEVRATMNLPALPGGDELANPYTTTSATGPATPPAKEAA